MDDKPITVDGEFLAELDALAEKATPRPWFAQGICVADTTSRMRSDALQVCTCHRALTPPGERHAVRNDMIDAAYIAAACNALPALVEAVRRWQRRVAVLRAVNSGGILAAVITADEVNDALGIADSSALKEADHE